MSDRLRQVELHAEILLARRKPVDEEVPDQAPATRAPVVPVPRRARVFLRHGAGAFADVTLTHPIRVATVRAVD